MHHDRCSRWQDHTPRSLAALAVSGAVAVWPLAAIEQHGEHLPLSTDLDIARGLTDAALGQLRGDVTVCVLPPLAIGMSREHAHFPGTLSLSAHTALAAMTEIGKGVAGAGFRRLVMLNSHGGNRAVIDLAALALRESRNMLVVRANYFLIAAPPDVLPPAELRHGLHGGALETALMLHLAPQAVRLDLLPQARSLGEAMASRGQVLGPEAEAGFAWMAEDLNPGGTTGDARLASAALGARLVRHYGGKLARVIEESFDFDLARLGSHG
ncbi:MAG: creatininase family protein [Pseudomonadales bacterium]|nr:creatininase family protein [Pseudomonadales bacterium]MBP9034193.1 creatininase family protein [Pseudomonadales bacterium]